MARLSGLTCFAPSATMSPSRDDFPSSRKPQPSAQPAVQPSPRPAPGGGFWSDADDPPTAVSSACLHFSPLLAELARGGVAAIVGDLRRAEQGGRRQGLGLGLLQWLARGRAGEEGAGAGEGAGEGTLDKVAERRLLALLLGTPMAAQTAHFRVSTEGASEPDVPEKLLALQVVKQFLAAAGGGATSSEAIGRSRWVSGKVTMWPSEVRIGNKVHFSQPFPTAADACGSFTVAQVHPNSWRADVSMSDVKVSAGCNGISLWRHTSWDGSHSVKGPLRPLRRLLQGLDPRAIARAFARAVFACEQEVDGEECHVVKVGASAGRMEEMGRWRTCGGEVSSCLEVVLHETEGSFSVRTGLLLRLRDKHVIRMKDADGKCTYWEQTTDSRLGDYRSSGGFMVAHSGHTSVALTKFGDPPQGHVALVRVEELWAVDAVLHDPMKMASIDFEPPANSDELGKEEETQRREKVKETRSE